MPKTASAVRTCRFDQMATMINDRVDDPAESGVERYVGLEHLDADSLRIRRWGDITDVESTKLRFKPGDIIFGKRRVYQRKLAVADFEGICSAHAMVLRARPDVVLPEFLPFFMQSDLFMERALAISVGSLSPTINWTDLAAQEFALPPIEEQQRVLACCSAVSRAIGAVKTCRQSLSECRNAMLTHVFAPLGGDPSRREIQDVPRPRGVQIVPARDLCSAPITKGDTPRGEHVSASGTIPFIKIYNLNFDGRLDFTVDPTFVSKRFHTEKLKRSIVFPGDVLTNLVGPPLGKVGLVPPDYPEWNINQAIARFRPRNEGIGRLLWFYLQSEWAKRWLLNRSKKTSGQRNLTLELAQELPVPVPADSNAIVEVLGRLDSLDAAGRQLTVRMGHLERVRQIALATLAEAKP